MVDNVNSWSPKEVVEVNASSSVLTEKFTAIAGQTLFNITSWAYTPLTHSLLIFRNGTLLVPNVDVFEDTSTSFHTAVASAAGDILLAVGFVGVSAETPAARDTDIFIGTYALLRDYSGTETTIYVQGGSAAHDGGEGWFTKITGAVIGAYVDNGADIILPTGGDGTIAWVMNKRDSEWIEPTIVTYVSATQFTILTDVTAKWAVEERIKLIGNTDRYATISVSSYSSPNTTITVKNVTTPSGFNSALLSTMVTGYLPLVTRGATSILASKLPIPFIKASGPDDGTVDAVFARMVPELIEYSGLTVAVELLGSITVTNPTFKLSGSGGVPKPIVKGNDEVLDLADMEGANRRCLFSYDSGLDKWILLNPSAAIQATETSLGAAELATQAETDAGTDDLRIVTPLKLLNFTGPTISGYVGGNLEYIESDVGADSTVFDIDAVIGAAWESVGPTGSGATNIWTALDSVPVGAKWVELDINHKCEDNTGAALSQIIYKRVTGSSFGLGLNILSRISLAATGSTLTALTLMDNRKVPIDSSQRFDLYITIDGTSRFTDLYLVGFGV